MTSFLDASSRLRTANARRFAAAIGLSASLTVVVCKADPMTSSVAQVLFDDGRKLMQAGRYAEACEKLAESERLEPAAGTMLNLALCHEYEGKTAAAWLAYVDAIALAAREQNTERQSLARERLAALEPKLSRLLLVVPEALPRGYWVELDGVALKPTAWGTALPIERGVHRVRYGAPGHTEQRASLSVAKSGTHTISLDVPPLVPKAQQREAPQPAPNRDTAWFVVGASGLGLGVMGLAGAAYFGVRAKDTWDERNELCNPICSSEAADAGGRAQDFAWASNGLAAAGVIGLGAGVYALWLHTPARATAPVLNASVGAQRAQLTMKGSF